jgi:SulP family sulfate permease
MQDGESSEDASIHRESRRQLPFAVRDARFGCAPFRVGALVPSDCRARYTARRALAAADRHRSTAPPTDHVMSEHVAHEQHSGGLGDVVRGLGVGATQAMVLLARMLPLGLIAYAALGPAAVEPGVRAVFAAAAFGNLTVLVLGGAVLPNEIPRASTVLVFAAFVARLAGDPQLHALPSGGVPELLFLASLCIVLSGLIQAAFGLLRLGSIARFVPYPVVAGLMTGLAISLVVYELPHVLGTHAQAAGEAAAAVGHAVEHGAEQAAAHGAVQPWVLAIALLTMVVVVVVSLKWPTAPSKLAGVVVGTGIATLLHFFAPSVALGDRLPAVSGALPVPDALLPLLSARGIELVYLHAYDILVAAFVIAVVGSLDSLLAAVGEADGPLDTGHQPNRLLLTVGLGNVVAGLFGGVPVAYSSEEALQAERVGAHKVFVSIVTTGTLVLLVLYGGAILRQIPVAVLAGVTILIAISLVDRWAGATLQRVRRHQYDRELTLNLLLVLIVAGVTVVFGLVSAVVTGLILSMALFIAVMNRSLVRGVSTGETRASRRVYPPELASVLRAQGQSIRLLDIDGAIFFGTADRLGVEVHRVAAGARFVILDLQRVTLIDASGALVLERMSRRLREDGVRLLLAPLSETSPLGRALLGAGVFTEKHHPDWFVDSDRALEWAEGQLLQEARAATASREMRIGEFALMAGLSAAELDFMKPYLDRQLLPAGSTLFHAGERGDRLFLLSRGAVSVVADDPGAIGKSRRIVTLAPGVIFGESAMLEHGTHSVTAVAEEEIVLYSLSRQHLAAIRAANRDLHERLLLNLLDHLAGLLRVTAGTRSDAGDPLESTGPARVAA